MDVVDGGQECGAKGVWKDRVAMNEVEVEDPGRD